MPVNGFVARVWFLADGTQFAFDAVIRETHSFELTVTDNPVETGVVVSDHAYMQPLRLEMDCRVSDVQLHPAPDDFGDVFGDGTGGRSRSAAAWDALTKLQESAEPFSVQTGLELYTNLVIVSLSATQDKDTCRVLDFHVVLREVTVVGTQQVTFPPRKPKKPTRQGTPNTNNGEKQAEPVTAPQPAETIGFSLLPADMQAQFKAQFDQMAAAQAAGTSP